ncbi:modulator of macroautophagy TMEM150B isoform X2 [Heterodontus francisci]|uniref:modulator of macroautophagy TMEM150B isoform X2 n=1 Tax=Heterodontus francisci TaxID=7792 RepID=UPI00355AE59E
MEPTPHLDGGHCGRRFLGRVWNSGGKWLCERHSRIPLHQYLWGRTSPELHFWPNHEHRGFSGYQQVIDYGYQSSLNIVSLVAGCLCAVGASLVGNFQTVNQIYVHLVGAFLTFFIGNLYFWLQVVLTYKIKPKHGGKWIGPVRIICSLVCTVCLILLLLLHYWKRRTAAAICEWIAGMVLLLLFGLFAVDFQHIDGQYFHVMRERATIQNSTTTLEL